MPISVINSKQPTLVALGSVVEYPVAKAVAVAAAPTGSENSFTVLPVVYSVPKQLTIEEAVRILQNHFFLLDTAAGVGSRDGLIGRNDLEAVLASPDAPEELRQAAAMVLRNPMYYNSLDTAQNGGRNDGLIGKGDLDAFLRQLSGGVGGSDPAAGGDSKAEELAAIEDAIALHDAMDGWGTDEEVLTRILSSRTSAQIRLIKEKYRKLFNTSLDSDIRSDTSGDYEDLLIKLSNRNVDENGPVNERQAYRDAVKLNKAMDGWGTDEGVLIAIIGGVSRRQLEAIAAAYADLYGISLRGHVHGETSGDFRDLLMRLLP